MVTQELKLIENGGVASGKGFIAGATYAGLKTYDNDDKLDLAILHSETPCTAAGVFTTNRVVSPTVTLDRERIKVGQPRTIIVNSGCANTCVGPQGMIDAVEMGSLAAHKVGVGDGDVLVASTGIIGVELPMALVRPATERITLSDEMGGHDFARAIMTTDSHPKETALFFELDGKKCTLGAAAKGVGMIHPQMATMLCFVATDAAVEAGFLRSALDGAVDRSLNMVTIDGDMSTNDMVVVLANAQAGNKPIEANTPEAAVFQTALTQVCLTLTEMIARDGEGATKLIEVVVEGAASPDDAKKVARSVASSSLVKAAVHGADPNWGRVIMAVGGSGANVVEDHLALYINGICMFDGGTPIPFFRDLAVRSMREGDAKILIKLNQGEYQATAWGCDLTQEYVEFNSAYTT